MVDDIVHLSAWKSAVSVYVDAPDFERQAIVYTHPSGMHRCFVYGTQTFTCLTAAVAGVLNSLGIPASTELVLPLCLQEADHARALVARVKLQLFAHAHTS